MSHDFHIADEIDLVATPEQVWEAIATGPGVDSWFMGHTEIRPGEGGSRRLDMTDSMGFVQTSAITGWESRQQLAFREDDPDGTFTAVEYQIEGREGGITRLRFAHYGILTGDDWQAQYDGMQAGDRMYLEQLATYLKYFPGRHATSNLFLVGPTVPDNQRVWSRFATALSLSEVITLGARVRLNVPGLPATDGVVAFLGEPDFVGTRTQHGIYQFIKGYRDRLFVGYHGFSDDEDDNVIELAWRSWLASAAVAST